MPSIIKQGQIVEDNWQVWRDSDSLPDSAHVIVPLALWQAQRDALLAKGPVALFLASDESPKALSDDDLEKAAFIAVDFPKFMDGRGFSYARELREQRHYQGEIRAIGDFMRDQLFYMQRCGFSSYALPSEELEAALASFNDFTESYQPSIDQPRPLFRRRA
ncbi:DUF934 domain-containing protein [Spongiibacter tropicus]|uniref:DUF934 domain-containing protein n=1 Tax=Spongiibacter tropicus TaxID=454602 RepID=UPI0035BE3621